MVFGSELDQTASGLIPMAGMVYQFQMLGSSGRLSYEGMHTR